jgi:hypothetical protein
MALTAFLLIREVLEQAFNLRPYAANRQPIRECGTALFYTYSMCKCSLDPHCFRSYAPPCVSHDTTCQEVKLLVPEQ